jgi:hypothetical protein
MTKDISWLDREGDEEIHNDLELDQEKIKLEIKKKIKAFKKNKTSGQANTSDTIKNMLEYLSELQSTEKELYEILKDDNDSTNKKEIISKINDLSSKRDKLYIDMKQMSKDVNKQNKNTSSDYSNQLQIVSIAEKELNREKDRLKILNAEKYNKLRMVEINTYYSKKYEALAYVTILAIIIFVIVILINILTSKGIIPEGATNTLNPILIGIGIFILFLAYWDIIKRSKFYFDEYTYSKEDASSGDGGGEIGIWPKPDIGLCIGENCCDDGTEYDADTDTCKVPSAISNNTDEDGADKKDGFKVITPYRLNNNYESVK